jgi:hypothetical protein
LVSIVAALSASAQCPNLALRGLADFQQEMLPFARIAFETAASLYRWLLTYFLTFLTLDGSEREALAGRC